MEEIPGRTFAEIQGNAPVEIPGTTLRCPGRNTEKSQQDLLE